MNDDLAMYLLTETSNIPFMTLNDEKFLDKLRYQAKMKSEYDGLRLDVILQEAEVFGNNKNMYSLRTLVNGMKQYEPKIRRGHSLMEDGHPIDPSTSRFTNVVRANSVAKILGYNFNGNLLNGKIELLNSVKGKDFEGMLLQGNFQGASSLRAIGSAKKIRGGRYVNSAIRIIAFDIVQNQSFEQATFQKVLTESEVVDLINISKNVHKLSETTEFKDIITEDSGKLSEDGKKMVFCQDGKCLEVFLEEHLIQQFNNEIKIS